MNALASQLARMSQRITKCTASSVNEITNSMVAMNFQDSPLSITSSIAGILTFVVAIAATIYARLSYLRNADKEFFQVKSSLTWYKTESTWMYDLVNAADSRKKRVGSEKEYQMYVFVMDQLRKLEERLLSLLTQAENEANTNRQPEKLSSKEAWTVIPQRYRTFEWPTATATAVSWLSVRAKALELVRQRDALGSRVQFAQLSMISSYVLAISCHEAF